MNRRRLRWGVALAIVAGALFLGPVYWDNKKLFYFALQG